MVVCMPCKALGEGLVEGLRAKKTMVVCMPRKALGEGLVEGLGAKKPWWFVCHVKPGLGESSVARFSPVWGGY
jgi:hypothetical protein